jgi:hypothetical protein
MGRSEPNYERGERNYERNLNDKYDRDYERDKYDRHYERKREDWRNEPSTSSIREKSSEKRDEFKGERDHFEKNYERRDNKSWADPYVRDQKTRRFEGKKYDDKHQSYDDFNRSDSKGRFDQRNQNRRLTNEDRSLSNSDDQRVDYHKRGISAPQAFKLDIEVERERRTKPIDKINEEQDIKYESRIPPAPPTPMKRLFSQIYEKLKLVGEGTYG